MTMVDGHLTCIYNIILITWNWSCNISAVIFTSSTKFLLFCIIFLLLINLTNTFTNMPFHVGVCNYCKGPSKTVINYF